jgi:hypothetical protein
VSVVKNEPFLKSGHLGGVRVVEDSLLRRLVSWSFSFHFYGLLPLNLSSHAITVELREGAANFETGENIERASMNESSMTASRSLPAKTIFQTPMEIPHNNSASAPSMRSVGQVQFANF